MTCSISLNAVEPLAPDANNTPASLRISGDLTGTCQQLFLQLAGHPGLLAPVVDNHFEAELLLGEHYQAGDVLCDSNNDALLSIQCLSGDSCQIQQPLGFLSCPECVLSFAANAVQGIAGTVTDTPVEVTIRGNVSGCDGVQVRFIYASGDPGATAWKDAVVQGEQWQATFTYDPGSGGPDDYPKDVACAQTITVEARCTDGDDCFVAGDFELVCRQSRDCPTPGLSADITKECRNNRRVVIFTVTLSGVTDDTVVAGQINTGDTSIGPEIQIPLEYSAQTAGNWSGSGGVLQRSFEHTYPPGVYEPVLTLVGTCAAQAEPRPISDPDGNPLDDLTITPCDCSEATIAVQVCRVTNERLTCEDPIGEDDCQPLSEAQVQDGNLPPGLYLLTAQTDPPGAGPISWSVNGAPQPQATGSGTFCLELTQGQTLTVNAAANLGLNCAVATDGVTLQATPLDDDDGGTPGDDDGNGDDGNGNDDGDNGDGDDGNGNGDGGDGDGDGGDGDGCLINWCKVWLLINIGLAFFAGAAIVITACFLFNPATLTNAFWVGVIISVVLVVVSILSFIAWGIICGRLPEMCGPLVWVHDILLLLSAASGLLGLLLLLLGQAPCAVGFFIDFAYYGILAAITEVIIRVVGCPLGQNGIVGVLIGIVEWIAQALGLDGGT